LTADEYHRLLRQFAREPMSEESAALETLLYYGRQARELLVREGAAPLDDARAAFLSRELEVTHALIAFRIVDEQGLRRVWMPPTRVPLDRRHEFHMEVEDLPPLITSGTVKRVGLSHLWNRL
jgi:hypothetical protein